MHPLLQSILADGPVITDGAWGTQMQMRGLAVGDSPDEWNLSHPERVEEVAAAYVKAGSQIILSNTFGANSLMLSRHGLDGKAAEINRAGAAISKKAAGKKAAVFASMGPTGKMLMMGDVTADAILDAFSEQAAALAAGGADAIVVETMADLEETRLAVQAAKITGLPVVACMVFDTGAALDRTMMGVTPEQAATELSSAGADVIGANCGQGIDGFIQLCRRMHAATDRPIWIKANAGLPTLVNGTAVYKTSAEDFASKIPLLVDAGASFVGGCCGTSPAFIQAICAVLKQ